MESNPEIKQEKIQIQCPCRGCGMGQCTGCRMYGCGGCPYRRRGCGRCRFCLGGRQHECPFQGVTNLGAMEYFDSAPMLSFNSAPMLSFNRIILILILILVIYIAFKHYNKQ